MFFFPKHKKEVISKDVGVNVFKSKKIATYQGLDTKFTPFRELNAVVDGVEYNLETHFDIACAVYQLGLDESPYNLFVPFIRLPKKYIGSTDVLAIPYLIVEIIKELNMPIHEINSIVNLYGVGISYLLRYLFPTHKVMQEYHKYNYTRLNVITKTSSSKLAMAVDAVNILGKGFRAKTEILAGFNDEQEALLTFKNYFKKYPGVYNLP